MVKWQENIVEEKMGISFFHPTYPHLICWSQIENLILLRVNVTISNSPFNYVIAFPQQTIFVKIIDDIRVNLYVLVFMLSNYMLQVLNK